MAWPFRPEIGRSARSQAIAAHDERLLQNMQALILVGQNQRTYQYSVSTGDDHLHRMFMRSGEQYAESLGQKAIALNLT